MTKKRNHYIPQFLLRRFASRSAGKRHWLWQFRTGSKPAEIVTENAALSTLFYGDPSTGIEDTLAELEGKQAALLRELDGGADTAAHADELQQFVWCMAFRTRAVRNHFADAAERGITHLAATNERTIAEALRRDVANNYDEHIREFIAKLPAPQAAVVRRHLSNPKAAAELRAGLLKAIPTAAPQARSMLEQAAGVMHAAAESGHVKAMTAMLDSLRSGSHVGLRVQHWTVHTHADRSVVLGDGAVFAVGPNGETGTIGRFMKDFVSVYAPLSHTSVLVGHRDSDTAVLPVDAINWASARLSLDSLFASRNTAVEAKLVAHIGTGEPIIAKDELRRIVDDNWNTFGASRSS